MVQAILEAYQNNIIPFPVYQETGNGIILAYLSTNEEDEKEDKMIR